MRKIDWKKAAVLALVLFAPALPMGCSEPSGTAGGVGAKIDNTLDPRGPAQKVGDKIDNAVGK